MSGPGATPAAAGLPRSADAAARHGPGALRHIPETGSTNADLADEARAGDASGAVLVADHQTAGRGRLDRTWEDDAGAALLVSIRMPAPAARASAVAAAVSAAARAVIDALVDPAVLAKWPNDLVITDGAAPGKLAGVLAEFVPGDEPCVVVGIGINVSAIDRAAGSTSVVENGGPADRDRILAGLLTVLPPRLADPGGVRAELRRYSATVGTDVRVELPGGDVLEGHAVRIDDDGRLVIRPGDGPEITIGAGDVVHLRPA